MTQALRPRPNDPITLLLEIASVPIQHAARAGTVLDAGLMVPRTPDLPPLDGAIGGDATVLFSRGDRLYRWPMRLEEVLPASLYLVAMREPGEGERRQFVRADVPLRLRLRAEGGGPWRTLEARIDLSAAGLRAIGVQGAAPAAGRHELELLDGEADEVVIRAVAEVVRTVARDGAGSDIAFRFAELSSTDEGKLVDVVFAAREASLRRRLGLG